jgi:hypothetical protein
MRDVIFACQNPFCVNGGVDVPMTVPVVTETFICGPCGHAPDVHDAPLVDVAPVE